MPLAAHGVTDRGRRQSNEDAMLVDSDRGLFIVADGMGGHNAGEVASDLAVRTVHDYLAAESPSEDAVVEALCLANDQVLAAAGEDPSYVGMGTTIVVAWLTGDKMLFGSVGDSRIYLWRRDTLTQLTTDDSWLTRMLPEEGLSPEDVQRHPMRHVLTKVVGLRDDMEPAVGVGPFQRGDALLLCSDGLHGSLPDDRIAETLGSAAPVQHVAQRLVSLALESGATDNVTVILVRRE
jgi:protein phosphatase